MNNFLTCFGITVVDKIRHDENVETVYHFKMRDYKIILVDKVCSHLYSIVQNFSCLLIKVDARVLILRQMW